MEQTMQALEVVCSHFRKEHSVATIANLRKRLNRAYRRNALLNRELIKVRCQQVALKLLNVFLLAKYQEMVQDLAALNRRLAV